METVTRSDSVADRQTMSSPRPLRQKLLRLGQALGFSILALVLLAGGLGVGTYSVALANEAVFGTPASVCLAE